ncbi:hypothetical protein [Orrella marina]|uniref:hypothetical protein n=1 Tax=Orrella marina TaxID=2163011 RepID=UPI00131F3850|nr:hypothetical protein [Orrella marina]
MLTIGTTDVQTFLAVAGCLARTGHFNQPRKTAREHSHPNPLSLLVRQGDQHQRETIEQDVLTHPVHTLAPAARTYSLTIAGFTLSNHDLGSAEVPA